jgi:hypothetical protein
VWVGRRTSAAIIVGKITPEPGLETKAHDINFDQSPTPETHDSTWHGIYSCMHTYISSYEVLSRMIEVLMPRGSETTIGQIQIAIPRSLSYKTQNCAA